MGGGRNLPGGTHDVHRCPPTVCGGVRRAKRRDRQYPDHDHDRSQGCDDNDHPGDHPIHDGDHEHDDDAREPDHDDDVPRLIVEHHHNDRRRGVDDDIRTISGARFLGRLPAQRAGGYPVGGVLSMAPASTRMFRPVM